MTRKVSIQYRIFQIWLGKYLANIKSLKCDQGGDNTAESVETVQGAATTEQEEEKRKEKVENSEKDAEKQEITVL